MNFKNGRLVEIVSKGIVSVDGNPQKAGGERPLRKVQEGEGRTSPLELEEGGGGWGSADGLIDSVMQERDAPVPI